MDGANYGENTFEYVPENRTIKEKRTAIIPKIRSMQSNTLPGRTIGFRGIPGTVSDAVIYQRQKELITKFAAQNGIHIEPTFWNLGDLRRRVIGGGRVDCDGREEEMRRYKEIGDLCREIEELKKSGSAEGI